MINVLDIPVLLRDWNSKRAFILFIYTFFFNIFHFHVLPTNTKRLEIKVVVNTITYTRCTFEAINKTIDFTYPVKLFL